MFVLGGDLMGDLLRLVMSFVRVGMFGFGGGSAVAPLIYKEVVEKYSWLTEEEFIEIVALANTLPGPSMVEMATAVGYKRHKYIGAFLASFAIVFPMMLIFTIVLVGLNEYIPVEILNAVTTPVLATVAAIMFSLSKRFYVSSKKELSFRYFLIISALTFLMIYFLKIHPSIIIITMLIIVSLRGGRK